MPQSKVVQVDKYQTLKVINGQVEKIDLRTNAVLDRLGPAATDPASADPYRRAAKLRADAGIANTPPAVDLGGNCPTDWNQQHIQSFTTTWTVPPPPSDSTSTGTYFIWNGLAGGALQPVLQWGNGTAAYQIANWYYVGGQYAHGTYKSVSPGDQLTGTIQYVSQNGSNYTYKESFAGYPDQDVTVNRTGSADGVIECYESYVGGDATKNPNASYERMTNITLADQPGYSTPATIGWAGDSSKPILSRVISNSSSNGEVDLYFVNSPS
ncbi:hypothetical protein ACFY2W_21890 [Streptomyces sp. NPDC001262]|uniref:hypothetical protein n=1 Tax=unclassified Streptomyces TaxID=2593676 RepID=UPI0036CCD4F9